MDAGKSGETVPGRADLPRDRARIMVRASLQTPPGPLAGGEPRDLAARLPPAMREWLTGAGEPR
jgi:uncharacterized protein (DUF2267 family)